MNIMSTHVSRKSYLIAVSVVLMLVAIMLLATDKFTALGARQSSSAVVTSQQTSGTTLQKPTISSQVTVNGEAVPSTRSSGVTTIDLPSKTSTTIDQSDDDSQYAVSQQENNTAVSSEVNVSSDTSGTGQSTNMNFGSTQVYGSSFSNSHNGSSLGFSSTHVFSTGQDNVSIVTQ